MPVDKMTFKQLSSGSREDACRIFTRSFSEYPLYIYLFPDKKARSAALPHLFTIAIDDLAAQAYGLYDQDVIKAVLLIDPPDLPAPGWFTSLKIGLKYGWRFPIRSGLGMLRVFSEFEKKRPSASHWYVQLVAVDHDCQGAGLGSKCLEFMAQLSGTTPVYLETNGPQNVAFYLKNGYRQARHYKCDNGAGPETWCFIST